MIQGDREPLEVEALLTDHYLDGLLSARDDGPVPVSAFGSGMAGLDRGVRIAALRLQRDLPRFRPPRRFEERLGLRLAEVAASLKVARAAGPAVSAAAADPGLPGAELVPGGDGRDRVRAAPIWAELDARSMVRPALIGGAVASAAISILAAAAVTRRRRQRRGRGATLVGQLVGRGRIIGELVD